MSRAPDSRKKDSFGEVDGRQKSREKKTESNLESSLTSEEETLYQTQQL